MVATLLSASKICLLICILSRGHFIEALQDISKYIKHYEGLSYDREILKQQHQRIRRETHLNNQELHLDFNAFQRAFHLRLKPDVNGFTEDFKVQSEDETQMVDLSHIFSGVLEDDSESSCQGSVVEGQFEGSITTANGTFYVEPTDRYSTSNSDHHSIIYHEDDVDSTPLRGGHVGFCGAERLQHLVQNHQEVPVSRSKRKVDQSKTSCLLHLYADHRFYKRFGSVEAVVAQVASYMKAVNDIYDKADFDGIELINFKVKFLTVITEEDPSSPLSKTHIGPEKLLSLFSEMNWSDYCLSYLLTDRDFSGVLGLAWEGKEDDWGGICSEMIMKDGRNCSHNTGLITLQNYGSYLSPKLVHLTFAHELGHSLGAPHDEGSDCGGLKITGGKGRFLMFPQATNKIEENSDKFSPCSLRRMSHILNEKKDRCFVVSEQPICGNRIVEEGEECDVGHDESDPCCYSSKEPSGIECRLKPEKQCSPSQGLCCSSHCVFKQAGLMCERHSECRNQSVCSGSSAVCPEPPAKPDRTICSDGTRICFSGECGMSLCTLYDMVQCDCPGENKTEKCHMCCQQRDKPNTCASTTSSVLLDYFGGKRVALVPGSPCSGNRGYCDKFKFCRILDADGPIARLKNSFLKLDEFDDLADWMKAHWWAILLAILTISAVMAGVICVFGQPLEIDDDR
ncbi:disintegrin and metalloproteinase domain-containing protein 10 [Ctenopharyngodon idella]|uniref:disintegrin and metalloproteinase domain-containing protein 10 n=1 Tax=Ctenopharyngodon idella TaxID=7959 RepID=UPI002230AA1E|nr:disintegrin and metalloproteinase domain-containing protein 10 [Ctenopharyngodon idella]